MPAIRVRTSTGWQDVAIIGPTGPTGPVSTVPGPTGPTGPAGAASTVPGPTGPGVPVGGATNYLLAKKSATDYDTQWVVAPTGGGGSPSRVGPERISTAALDPNTSATLSWAA